jgi:uncharacterized protein YkwD
MKKIILSVFLISAVMSINVFSDEEKIISGGENAFITEALNAHNKFRTELNIPPLKWSDKLAKNAKVWADRLAAQRRMYHSSGTGEGENLWMGTSGYYSITQMVDAWGGEKKFYKHGVFPNVSSSGNWADVGHYTQIIWKNTTEVGCAKSSGGGYDYFVCRYSPPGNYLRQKAY